MRTLLLSLLLALTLTVPARAETLVLVSLDGFRWDYLDIHPAPAIAAMAEEGVRVTRLHPVYPSKTFPGHLSMATGLPPTGHGIVANHFCDRDRGDCYSMGDGKRDATWLSGIPLWNLVELHGGRAATYFWPESDARVGGLTPSFHYPYSQRSDYGRRVAQVLDWLRLPPTSRPQLVTLYFSAVDSAGHAHGPEAPETAAAVARVDALVGELWAGIEALPEDDINLMVVSDHGMARIDGSRVIDTQTLPAVSGFTLKSSSSQVFYYRDDPGADTTALVARLDAAAEGRYRVVDADTLAARGFVGHPGVPDVLIEALPPAYFRSGGGDPGFVGGAHGNDWREVPDMDGFLVGIGPAFRDGAVIDAADQLDIYPVAARILGLELLNTVPSDGGELRNALRDSLPASLDPAPPQPLRESSGGTWP